MNVVNPVQPLDDNIEIPPKDEEELALERLVFGDLEHFQANLRKVENLYDYSSDDGDVAEDPEDESDSDIDGVQDDDLFFIDDGAAEGNHMEIDENGVSDIDSDEENAWEDSDDERMNVSVATSDRLKKLRKTQGETSISGASYVRRLRAQFEKIYPRPAWADQLDEEPENADDGDDMDADETPVSDPKNNTNAVLSVLAATQQFVVQKKHKLIPPHKISITRLKDANQAKRSRSGVQAVAFHHTHPLMLTAGYDRTIRVFHIDGKANSLVTSLHFKDLPIQCAGFSPLGNEDGKTLVFAGGRRRYMHKWDLSSGDVEKISRMYGHESTQRSFEHFVISPTGKYVVLRGSNGWANLVSGETGRWITGFKMEGNLVDFDFARDESYLVMVNSAGEVSEYAVNESANAGKHQGLALRKWRDDGVGITKVKLGGPNNRWLAVGSNNGLVSIYDRKLLEENPKPFKSVGSLVSSISLLEFSPDGQVLCIASRGVKDALRLVHMPSGTVFSNWPTSGTPLGRVTSVLFTPNNQMLAVGNDVGKVTLWRLNHY